MTTETSFDIRPAKEEQEQEQPNRYRSNVRPAPYRIPAAPPIAWASDNSPRRAWVSRLLLACLLILQAVLTLRLRNSASPTEMHVLPDHRGGTDFTGGSSLYPALAQMLENATGVQGARFLSMVFMVCATGLLYSWSTRLFNERVGLVAAGAFTVIAPTQVLGALATEDALSLFLLALATWLVVLSRSGPFWPAVAAAPVALLAVVVKFGALFYLPWLVMLAVLVSLRHTAAGQAVLRAAPLAVAFLASAGYYVMATSGLTAPEGEPVSELLKGWLNWIGLFTAFGLLGVVMYTRRARMGEVPTGASPDPSPAWRLMLGTAMVLPALLSPFFLMAAPAYGTVWRPQFAFGALLAATMVGVGLVRLVGAHFHFPNLGIAAAVALLSLGMTQSEYEYTLWPSYENVAEVVDTQVQAEGRYLASDPETFSFYMDNYRAAQWNATKELKDGSAESVLKKRTYGLIVLQTPAGSAIDKDLLEALRDGVGNYRMLTGEPFRLGWTGGSHQLWIPDLVHPVK